MKAFFVFSPFVLFLLKFTPNTNFSMKKITIIITAVFYLIITPSMAQEYTFKPFEPPVSFSDADKRADDVIQQMSLEDKIQLIGGHHTFFIKGFEKYKIPQLYLSDATQGVHIRKELSNLMEKSTAFPCPIALTATWNPELAYNYAKCIGEECRASDVAVLLGPGMNIYRISQNGRNFEYFGEDPFLAARMVENYVSGVQSTGTITTLKHFLCNNNEYYRRTTNAIVDERSLHEIYLPAFKTGIDAGAMAVMTSYNKVNGEWAGQSDFVINNLLRKQLGYKWLVMTDWWSTWDPEKTIKSGQDLEMPGDPIPNNAYLKKADDVYVKTNAARLIQENKVNEADINRMAKSIIRTCIAMGLYDRPVKDESLLQALPLHEKIALQTAREAIVLLKNNNILPLKKSCKILLTGDYVEKLARGLGSAQVEGYNTVTMLEALTKEFGDQLKYIKNPSRKQIKTADVILLSVGTQDSEGWDKPFEQPRIDSLVQRMTSLNPNVVVIVNTGGGIQMTHWNEKTAAILYSWYVGQNGNTALAEILAGKTNPSGKLPISIERSFKDSPGYPYIPKGESLKTGWEEDMNLWHPFNNLEYTEGVFVGYRWYESKNIKPLYPFGFGLSYTQFTYSNLNISANTLNANENMTVECTVKNTGETAGAEVLQLYIHDKESSIPRPIKELKGFKKVFLEPGESKKITLTLSKKDFSYWDTSRGNWYAEPGEFEIQVGASSEDIKLKKTLLIK
jgi:beta-glucosidase